MALQHLQYALKASLGSLEQDFYQNFHQKFGNYVTLRREAVSIHLIPAAYRHSAKNSCTSLWGSRRINHHDFLI